MPEEDDLGFFVIRNSRHSIRGNDPSTGRAVSPTEAPHNDRTSDADERRDVDEASQRDTSSLPIVRLVEAPRGAYALDFRDARRSFLAAFLAEHAVGGGDDAAVTTRPRAGAVDDDDDDDDDVETYVEGRAWRHLEHFGLLVGRPIEQRTDDGGRRRREQLDPRYEGSFVLLEDDVRDVVHALLSLDALFSWPVLADARRRGRLRWRDIRACLSRARRGVPFLTPREGILRHVVRTHLTFHQFVAFSRLLERHLESMDDTPPPPTVAEIKIRDLFPSFADLAPDEQVLEVRSVDEVFSLALISKMDLTMESLHWHVLSF